MCSFSPAAKHFLSEFGGIEREWLIENALQQEFLAAQTIGPIGEDDDHIHLVQEGAVSIYQKHPAGIRTLVAQACDGELIGEVAWLSGQSIPAEMVADVPAILLSWSRKILEEKLISDPEFGSAFYRAIAASCARKALERQVHSATHEQGGAHQDGTPAPNVVELEQRVRSFKGLMLEADRAAVKNFGRIPADLAAALKSVFCDLVKFTDTAIGNDAPLNPHIKAKIGKELQEQFLPYLSLTETADRFYSKPRGYAGDFLTIAKIYDDVPGGAGRLGPLMDACFLATNAAAAVRNRRRLLGSLIDDVLEQKSGAPTRVTSIACGPGQELFDVYGRLSDPLLLRSYLIDIDLQALAFVMEKASLRGLNRCMEAFNHNLLHLVSGRKSIQLPPQDLIYSIGLIDYFSDKFVVQLMNFIHDRLAPGGSVVLGNFHPRNSSRAFMDHVLEWKLIHRDEQDMNRLFSQSKFGRGASDIYFEDEGINLFARCIRSAT